MFILKSQIEAEKDLPASRQNLCQAAVATIWSEQNMMQSYQKHNITSNNLKIFFVFLVLSKRIKHSNTVFFHYIRQMKNSVVIIVIVCIIPIFMKIYIIYGPTTAVGRGQTWLKPTRTQLSLLMEKSKLLELTASFSIGSTNSFTNLKSAFSHFRCANIYSSKKSRKYLNHTLAFDEWNIQDENLS